MTVINYCNLYICSNEMKNTCVYFHKSLEILNKTITFFNQKINIPCKSEDMKHK